MGFRSASGVILSRRAVGEGDLLLTLFLKGMGMTFASALGAARGSVRFGGGTEPLVWGVFTIYRSGSGKKYLKSVDVADDMLKLRSRPDALFAAVRWAKLLTRYLISEDTEMTASPAPAHPLDSLLANFYWSLKLLDKIPAEAAEWRFLWRWLKNWGLAPELGEHFCHGRTPRELDLLREVAAAKASELTAAGPDLLRSLYAHRRLFVDAARRAEIFLKET